jgi:hypothetical protein
MQSANNFAFKEWAVVADALAAGRQSLLLRKGGIYERLGRFEVEHREFWIFPTRFHQRPNEIRPDALPLLQQNSSDAPPTGAVRLSVYAVVEEVIEIGDAALLPPLAELQILTENTVLERFRYRRPGLFILPVRVYVLARQITIADRPHYAGCRTWVDLERQLSTEGATPALSDKIHAARMESIRQALLER